MYEKSNISTKNLHQLEKIYLSKLEISKIRKKKQEYILISEKIRAV